MVKGQIELLITSLEPGGISEPNGNVQLFWYINSNCVFSKTIQSYTVQRGTVGIRYVEEWVKYGCEYSIGVNRK